MVKRVYRKVRLEMGDTARRALYLKIGGNTEVVVYATVERVVWREVVEAVRGFVDLVLVRREVQSLSRPSPFRRGLVRR